MNDKGPKRRFRLFDSQREGPGVMKDDRKLGYDIRSYFLRMFRNFSKIMTVNIIYVIGNFPLIFAIIAMAGFFNYTSSAPNDLGFSAIHGIMLHDASPSLLPILGAIGTQGELSALGTGSIILLCLSGLLIFTFGPVNAGTAYVLRNIVSGEPVFPWSDFMYALKKNIRQSLIYGVIDALLCGILAYDLVFFYRNLGTLQTNLMFYATLVCALLYFFMRYYMYVMMVTFDLSIFKLIKNSLIFSLLGFGRNLLALLGILIISYINYIIFVFVPGLGVALPFVMTVAILSYTAVFVSYYKIKTVMIDPYYEKQE